MLTKGGGATPNVYCNIKNTTAQHANQFSLSRRGELKVQPTQRSCLLRPRLVILDERQLMPTSPKRLSL